MGFRIVRKAGLLSVDDVDNDLLVGTNRVDAYGYPMHGSKRLPVLILERKLGRKLKGNEIADHIDGFPTNNRRSNLRPANPSLQNQNRNPPTGRIKGLRRQRDRWVARIVVYGRRRSKSFRFTQDTEETAKLQAVSWWMVMATKVNHGYLARMVVLGIRPGQPG